MQREAHAVKANDENERKKRAPINIITAYQMAANEMKVLNSRFA